jgi:hypothetical protein
MAEVPCGLIANPQRALDLISRHSFLRLTEQQDGKKPFLKWEVGVIEDCARGDRELIVASLAVKQLLRGRQLNDGHLTAQALNASGPAEAHKNLAAFFIGVEQVYNVN